MLTFLKLCCLYMWYTHNLLCSHYANLPVHLCMHLLLEKAINHLERDELTFMFPLPPPIDSPKTAPESKHIL